MASGVHSPRTTAFLQPPPSLWTAPGALSAASATSGPRMTAQMTARRQIPLPPARSSPVWPLGARQLILLWQRRRGARCSASGGWRGSRRAPTSGPRHTRAPPASSAAAAISQRPQPSPRPHRLLSVQRSFAPPRPPRRLRRFPHCRRRQSCCQPLWRQLLLRGPLSPQRRQSLRPRRAAAGRAGTLWWAVPRSALGSASGGCRARRRGPQSTPKPIQVRLGRAGWGGMEGPSVLGAGMLGQLSAGGWDWALGRGINCTPPLLCPLSCRALCRHHWRAVLRLPVRPRGGEGGGQGAVRGRHEGGRGCGSQGSRAAGAVSLLLLWFACCMPHASCRVQAACSGMASVPMPHATCSAGRQQ